LEASDTAVVQRVANLPGAIGIVPLRMASAPGVRALALSPVAGMDYVEPDMQTVHEGRYPITLFVNLFRRTRGPRLAGGFLTHVASEPGQRVVLQHGRVPTAVPLRFVRRSPLLGSH
jgi:ABC-type phosphate transport system substrate-binding protein